VKELPEDLQVAHTHSKELVEEPCPHGHRPNVIGRPALDVPDVGRKVQHFVVVVIEDHGDVGAVVVVRHGGGEGGRGGVTVAQARGKLTASRGHHPRHCCHQRHASRGLMIAGKVGNMLPTCHNVLD
jgi:hypothetical protein